MKSSGSTVKTTEYWYPNAVIFFAENFIENEFTLGLFSYTEELSAAQRKPQRYWAGIWTLWHYQALTTQLRHILLGWRTPLATYAGKR